MKFGFAATPRGSLQKNLAVFKEAERLGFDDAWVPDMTFNHDPFAFLAALATQTDRLHLGIGVTNPYTRHPVQVARSAVTIQELSGNRFRIGIGAGNAKQLLAPLGLAQVKTAQRIKTMVQLLERLLKGEAVSHTGPFWTLEGVRLANKPEVDIPIYVAARAPRTLAVAGAHASGAIVEALLSPTAVKWAQEQLAAGAAETGRPLPELVSWGMAYLLPDEADVTAVPEEIRHLIAHTIATMPPAVLEVTNIDLGEAEAIRRRYQEAGADACIPMVTLEQIQCIAMVGTPDQVVEQIQRLEQAGVARLIILLRSPEPEKNLHILRDFSEQVIARFR